MGVIQQAPGGGKVTVTNLAAGNVRSGVTVTVKQGAKTISSVAGTFTGPSTAASATSATHNNNGHGTTTSNSCSLSVPAGTFKAFITGLVVRVSDGNMSYNPPGSGFSLTFKGSAISSGSTITGPGTLTGTITIKSDYTSNGGIVSIFYG